MKYGQQNSNFRHGNYSSVDTVPEVKQALAKSLLINILTTKCDSRGRLPYTNEEQSWAVGIFQRFLIGEDIPQWANDSLRQNGFKPNAESDKP